MALTRPVVPPDGSFISMALSSESLPPRLDSGRITVRGKETRQNKDRSRVLIQSGPKRLWLIFRLKNGRGKLRIATIPARLDGR
jgi:hypothetical protein